MMTACAGGVSICLTGGAASGLCLQFFLDDGVPVDTALLRHHVEEALADIISTMLGQREGRPETAAPSTQQQPAASEVHTHTHTTHTNTRTTPHNKHRQTDNPTHTHPHKRTHPITGVRFMIKQLL